MTTAVALAADGPPEGGHVDECDGASWPEPVAWYCHAKRLNEEGELTGYCHARAGTGTGHRGVGRCKFDLGTSPTHVKAAEKMIARAALARLGRPAATADPAEELLACVREAKGNVEALRDLVAVLQDPELAALASKSDPDMANAMDIVRGIYGPDHLGDLRDHPLVSMYERWLSMLARFSAEAVKAGLAERMIKAEEEQVAMLATAMLRLLSHPTLALSYDQQATGRQLLGGILRQLGATESRSTPLGG